MEAMKTLGSMLSLSIVLGVGCGGGGSGPDGAEDVQADDVQVEDVAAEDGAAEDGADLEADAPEDVEEEELPWGGKTIDEPFTTERIELVDTATVEGFTIEFYRNLSYTCGMSGYQTFAVVYPEALPLTEERPLWVRMHGGGVGAFAPDGSYVPPGDIGMIDEESALELAGLLRETGLVAKIRTHPAGFRFLMPSMCDHDLYSGVGVPEPNNPYSPDENGETRAADGLLATKAAVAFTRERAATSHIFLQGTSAGSIGAFSVAYTFERSGLRLSGIVMDSHVLAEALADIIEAGCTPFDVELTIAKVGPIMDEENLPDRVVLGGAVTVPIVHVWDRGDPACCGENPITWVDDEGVEHTTGSCDYQHEAFRAAIEAAPPGGASMNLRLCVNAPATTGPGACDMHSPTKIAFDEPTPPGDQDAGGRDYNQLIADWVTERLADPPP